MGVASRKNPKEQFQKLLKKYKGKVTGTQGGLIPLFEPWAVFVKQNVFLIGDAAGFVKATTGGGLVPGLNSAKILANSLIKNSVYSPEIYLHVAPRLLLNLNLRKIMDSFTEKDWNELVKELNTAEAKKALQEVNRDKLFQLLLSIAVKNPRIMKYGLKYFDALL